MMQVRGNDALNMAEKEGHGASDGLESELRSKIPWLDAVGEPFLRSVAEWQRGGSDVAGAENERDLFTQLAADDDLAKKMGSIVAATAKTENSFNGTCGEVEFLQFWEACGSEDSGQ